MKVPAQICYLVFLLVVSLQISEMQFGQENCQVVSATASFSIPHRRDPLALNVDPKSEMWANAASAWITKDCTKTLDYPNLKTQVRAFWTDDFLYLLFVCPYEVLNLFLPPQNDKPRHGLWDRDVVEMFLGSDWNNIGHYREFEIAPTGDWIELAINFDLKTRQTADEINWSSGWQRMAKIDE